MPMPAYPFVPKSTRWLKRGQYWAIPLDEGLFGAGCVVGTLTSIDGKASLRSFIAGVLQWVGQSPPTPEVLTGRGVVGFSFAHLKAITESGGCILGEAELELSGVPNSAESLSLPTWGYGVPTIIARKLAKNAG
jgi:hypothetical protein